ncbi:MAG: hypothetical protein NFCOHLIN_02668 [Gammaproteobacteria bacterium]|nr:hypothetical protein [Gammaproteobacteria bacterium]
MIASAFECAIAAVREACAVTRAVQRELCTGDVLRKDDRSPVTVADFAAQALIARRLASVDPTVVIVGEESASILRANDQAQLRRVLKERLRPAWPDVTIDDALAAIDIGGQEPARAFWTLDPIDGTKGFVRNGQYAISLAWIVDGRVEFGVLGCPNLSADLARPFAEPDAHGLIIHARRGGGCWSIAADDPACVPQPVRHAPPADGQFRLCESAASGHSDQRAVGRVVEALGGARRYHLDSQAKYAVVARGQADCYLRMPVRTDDREYIWDHAPGEIIAVEAGARVSDMRGRPFDFGVGRRLERNGGILCASPEWHPRVVAAISAELAGGDHQSAEDSRGSCRD